MSTKYAILGLLGDRPLHGYEIKQDFEQRVGNVWSINIGQLYTLLKKMEQEALIEKKIVRQESRPDKIVYSITEKGRQDLQEWLLTPAVKRQVKDELFLKMLLLGNVDRDKALRFINSQIEQMEAQYQQFVYDSREYGDQLELFTGLLLEAAILHYEADIKWLRLAKQKLGY